MALVSAAKVTIYLLLSISADGRMDSPGLFIKSLICENTFAASKNVFHILTTHIYLQATPPSIALIQLWIMSPRTSSVLSLWTRDKPTVTV